jgi:hypothetical protein
MSQGALESAGIFQNNNKKFKNNIIIIKASDYVYSKVKCAMNAAILLSVNTVCTQMCCQTAQCQYYIYPNPWLPVDLEVSMRHLDLGTCVF